ncbi:4Fe-4S binding protein [Marinilabiliaceae bacterium JC017]|nr:4Fe-4S binding protein [Marinilabiliaceae bacterium JC017]
MKKWLTLITLFIAMCLQGVEVGAQQQQRFPKPEFESGYTQPVTTVPAARADFLAYLDILILIGALALISWLILKKRSRRGVTWVSVFSLLYFGFFRQGCVCSVGSLQNITLALFRPEYSIPLSALAFFVIPVVFTLFFGRTFCAGVCPFGALQDLILLRPLLLKKWLQKLLGLIPFLYLGLAILYAATATDFIICRYDPFIGIFRFDATFTMFIIGGIFLFVSLFVARPYCRFLCPYGVLLSWVSRVSKYHLTISPASCTQCRLCENACPVGAIQKPMTEKNMESRPTAVKRFMLLSFVLPAMVVLGGWTGANFHERLSAVNPKVQLAHELLAGKDNNSGEASDEVTAFRSSGKPVEELYSEAAGLVREFYWGGWILGGFIGLVFGLTLTGLSVFRYREEYSPHKGECVSCARCLAYCPVSVKDIKNR